jgi:hypothetical protein
MLMKSLVFPGLAVACVLAVGAPVTTNAAGAEDKKMTLTGCLVKGEGDDAGFLLTNTPSVAVLRERNSRVEPGVVGTAGTEPMFYWLKGDNDLKDHVGHQVEIQGDLKGDVKEGEIKLDRKASWTEMTIKADGRSIKAQVPTAVVYPSDKDEAKAHVLVRKVDVDHIKMLTASCDN